MIDIWSAACVSAELILGHPMFPGESGVDQLAHHRDREILYIIITYDT